MTLASRHVRATSLRQRAGRGRRSGAPFRAGEALLAFLLLAAQAGPANADDARDIVRAAVHYWRDVSSDSVVEMTIHRPDWERTMVMRVWTRGEKRSLVRVISPAKDAGNGTLLVENNMWTFNPKINRVIKIPSSMMSQSWMGSDFSNNDIARADDIVDRYDHRLVGTETHEGRKVRVIESTPHEDAPVVWGKERLKIRDDHVLLEHAFYDQEMKLVKRMVTLKVEKMGGKAIASRERMQKAERPEEWTEVRTKEARFGVDVPEEFFSLSNLGNPRP